MNEMLALDIGTGTVVGLLGRGDESSLELLAREERTHNQRAVEEGRIVDVSAAAQTVKEVVERLRSETGIGVNLTHFSVPGRGLTSRRIEAEIEPGNEGEIRRQDLRELRRRRPSPGEDRVVVDEEVVCWWVDGEEVRQPLGQQGRELKARWLRSSMPRGAIEVRRRVLERVGLVPRQVVLEPRAAVSSAFPGGEFSSTAGVIDFGAGTIDAAVVEGGRVRDFFTRLGGGDELSRRLEKKYRLDFEAAETVKTRLSSDGPIQVRNLGGESIRLSPSEVRRQLYPVLRRQLKEYRTWFEQFHPDVVVLAGGASQFPFLKRLAARTLECDPGILVARPPSLPAWMEDPEQRIRSSTDYTVLGLLMMAAKKRGRHYLDLRVNDEPVYRLTESEEFSVGDLAAQRGIRPREPDPDSAVMVCVDGDWSTFRRDQRLEPRLVVNGEEVDPDTRLRSGDEVRITPPDPPRPMEVAASRFLPEGELRVRFGDRTYSLAPRLVNREGETFTPQDTLVDGEEYESVTSFDRDDLRGELSARGEAVSGPLLVEQNGIYTDRDRFEIGETLRVETGLNPAESPLGRLTPPDPMDRPIERSLS